MFDNKTIIVPNGQLSNNVVINLSREGKRRLDINLKFNYSLDSNRIKSLLEDTIGSVDGTLKDPVCRIGIGELEPDRYTISVQVWVDAHGFQDTRFLLQERIMNDLKVAGVIATS